MPVDSKFFKGINSAQMTWYQLQYWLDDKDKFELLRDVAEHNAMFSNPDGVRQVRDSRENKYEMSNDEFGDLIKGAFGRSLPDSNSKSREITREDFVSDSLRPYLDLDLDEIHFTPYED